MNGEDDLLNRILLQGGGTHPEQLARALAIQNEAARLAVQRPDLSEIERVGRERQMRGLTEQGMGLAGAFGPEQMRAAATQMSAAGLEKQGPQDIGGAIYSEGRAIESPIKRQDRLTRAVAAQAGAGREFAAEESQETGRRLTRATGALQQKKLQQDLESGKWVKMKGPDDNEYLYNPQTNEVRRPGGGGAAPGMPGAIPPKLTEPQAASMNYGRRIATSNSILEDIGTNYNVTGLTIKQGMEAMPGLGGAAGAVGNMMLSEKQQQVEQAQRDFINAVLRRESGAVISPSEFENARRQYFPQPGDGEKVLAQKKANRDTVLESFRLSAGPGAPYVAAAIAERTPASRDKGPQLGGPKPARRLEDRKRNYMAGD